MGKAKENRHERLRPLFILKIICENTDEDHYITIAGIRNKLSEEYGITCHRVTVKQDIDLLIEAGYDIAFTKSTQNRYSYLGREFDTAELKVLIDAVASSRFISRDKSRKLIAKLGSLSGPFVSKELDRNVEVERRIKGDNEQIYYIIDVINTAINEKKKISFKYFKYNIKKEKIARHDGKKYLFSPYKLVWNGDYYYALGYSDTHGKVTIFRVDRIMNVPVIEDMRQTKAPSDFDINEYLNSMFRMYDGERTSIDLEADADVVDSFIDRFGENIRIRGISEDTFGITVRTVPSHVFFSWIFGFGGKVRIVSPGSARENYEKMVKDAFENL